MATSTLLELSCGFMAACLDLWYVAIGMGLPRFSGQVSRLHGCQCRGSNELLLVVDRTQVTNC